ncbi:MAG: DegQ family serine endoprotease [Rhodospirillaceae bacterium]|nr:DegQ family serine endoprotease [Rhodospirillaceae bacterium]
MSAAALIAALSAGAYAPLPASAQLAALPTRDGVPTLAPLIEKVTPAVVNVAVKATVELPDNPAFQDPLFRRFFGDPERGPRERRGGGSGVIIDAKNGYVMTNHHVIDGADEVLVRLKDDREFTAKVIGSDEGTDIALLQIKAENLTSLPLGDSKSMKVGDFVIAIGSPFGLGQTVTSGIVSALGRSGINIEGYEDFIQTDAAINPGNSGGPLINLKGEVVGINTAIFSASGGNIGIGFAVPTTIASAVKDQLIEFGEVRRGRIGIQIVDLNPQLAEALGIKATEGAVVQRVEKGSPGDVAGIKSEDVVVALDNEPVKGAQDLRNRVGLIQYGKDVTVTLLRDGKRQDVKVTLGKIQKEELAEIKDRPTLEGASFSNAEADDGTKGVMVQQIQRGSPAWQAQLREGDIIIAVNRGPVADVSAFEDALKKGGRQVALSVRRGDENLFLIVQ